MDYSAAPAAVSVALAAAIADLPAPCHDGHFIATVRAYAAWHGKKMAFLLAASGNISTARALQVAAGDPDPPLSVAVIGARFGSGWGDRLAALTSMFGFALRYQRVFLIHYEAIFPWVHSPFFDWQLDAARLPALTALLEQIEPLNIVDSASIWTHGRPDVEWPSELPVSPYLVTNRGIWSSSSAPEHRAWFTALASVPACMQQVLVRPTPALLAEAAVTETLAAFASARASGRHVLGFHFRAGDEIHFGELMLRWKMLANGTSEPADIEAAVLAMPLDPTVSERLQRELLNVAPHTSQPNAAVFFITDSLRIRALLKASFLSAISTLHVPHHIAHINSVKDAAGAIEKMRTTLIDWWLMSRVDAQVGTMVSGFSRSAAVASPLGRFHTGEGCSPCPCAADCHAAFATLFLPTQLFSGH